MEKQFTTEVLHHQGICDASAAIAVSPDSFVVASDEDNYLRLYDCNYSGPCRDKVNLSHDLDLGESQKEADIEGATSLDGITYWITSHGRTAKGKRRRARYKFFANSITLHDNHITYTHIGKSCSHLFDAMKTDKGLKKYKLDEAEKLPPKRKGGLNIEGLAATPDKHLLIGFRSPVPDNKALVVTLLNPTDVIADEPPVFNRPIELELHGLGIRSLEYWPAHDCYLVVAGPSQSGGPFKVFFWSGDIRNKPVDMRDIDLAGINAEGIVIYPNLNQRFQIISDDGATLRDGCICKKLQSDAPGKYFRSIWTDFDPAKYR